MPFGDVPGFVAILRDMEGTAAMALQFAILTAARTGEVLGATWEEIDIEERVWTVPAPRMKGGREHRVRLSPRAVAILKELHKTRTASAFVFSGFRDGRPLSNMAMTAVLRRASVNVTVHGFRSSFRDWSAETTNFPREVCEMALAHTIPNEVEAAYRRGDLFDKRRKLMDAWGRFCTAEPAKVVRLPA
jgi:integrase